MTAPWSVQKPDAALVEKLANTFDLRPIVAARLSAARMLRARRRDHDR